MRAQEQQLVYDNAQTLKRRCYKKQSHTTTNCRASLRAVRVSFDQGNESFSVVVIVSLRAILFQD